MESGRWVVQTSGSRTARGNGGNRRLTGRNVLVPNLGSTSAGWVVRKKTLRKEWSDGGRNGEGRAQMWRREGPNWGTLKSGRWYREGRAGDVLFKKNISIVLGNL